MIRRRHVIYVEGYDPQGAEGYYDLFQRSWRRFMKIWPLRAKVSPLEIDSDDFAHWTIEAGGPNWQVSTHYDFVRQEQMIRANMAEPMLRQVLRALGWTIDYLISGTMFRVYRASWQYCAALLFFQLGLLVWLALSAAGGWLVGYAALRFAGWPEILATAIGIAGAVAFFWLQKPLAKRLFLIQINSHWPYLLEYARGEKSCFDRPVERCAERLVEVARAGDADEILVIGHSGGGVLAPAAVARALELDPDLGRHGTPVVLLTLGSIMPGAAVHPRSVKLHDIVKRLAVEPSLRWIDVQSRKDVLNFWDFDPVAGIGIDAGPNRCNPLVWKVRFRDMLSPEFYERLRLSFFRMHYQFIMANDQRARYDYFMLVCGPVPVTQWAENGDKVLAAFGKDATYNG